MARSCVSAWVFDWCVRVSQPLIDEAEGKADAIHLAAEVGRLDVVSLMLAMCGLLFAVLALAGFWMIRGAAIRAAKDEARKVIQDEAPKLFDEARRTRGGQDKTEPVIDLSKLAEAQIIRNASEVDENGETSGQERS